MGNSWLIKFINESLCCYTGLIIGDGHIKKDKKRLSIELIDLDLIREIEKLTYSLFMIKPSIYKINDKRPNRKRRYLLQIDNSAIHAFLHQVIGIPKGNKSKIVIIPKLIKNTTLKNKRSLLIGLFVADGGKRHNKKVGLTTSSEILRNDVSNILNDLKITNGKEKWLNKKYEKEYFGLYFKRENLQKILDIDQNDQIIKFFDFLSNKIELTK